MTLMACLMLEDSELNDSFRAWPLHLTLAPWFELDGEHLPKFIESLETLAQGTPELALNIGMRAEFSHKDRDIFLVEPDADVINLHDKLLSALSDTGAQLDPSGFIAARFRPHITVPDDQALPAGELNFDKIYLVAKDNFGMKFVVYILTLAVAHPAHRASAVLRRLSHR